MAGLINPRSVEAYRKEEFVELSSVATGAAISRSLNVRETTVRCITDATNAITISLPSVAEAQGRQFDILFVTDGGANVTVTDKADDGSMANVVLTAAADKLSVISNGQRWVIVEEIST
jgi:hypothetical protein